MKKIWVLQYNDGTADVWDEEKGPPSWPYVDAFAADDAIKELHSDYADLRARLAEVEAQRDGLKEALIKIRDYTPYGDYDEHDKELFAKRDALTEEIKNCGECQYAKQVKWPQSGLCSKHYSPFMRLEDMITTMHDHKQAWVPRDIAREALAKLEAHDGVTRSAP